MPLAATRPDATPNLDDEARDARLAALVQRVADGDAEALGQLYDLTLGAVHALALRVLRQAQDAEEVVVDVYLQVWERAGHYDPARGPALGWLRTLAWSRALDHYRRRQRERQRRGLHPESDDGTYGPAWSADAIAEQLEPRLDALAAAQAMQALSTPQREVLQLLFGEDLSHAEAAQRLGWPLGTVKSHARRGLALLRAALSPGSGDA
ncbi:sigma-70 family RNA polymerase sigma factor [Silanimonas algicola]